MYINGSQQNQHQAQLDIHSRSAKGYGYVQLNKEGILCFMQFLADVSHPTRKFREFRTRSRCFVPISVIAKFVFKRVEMICCFCSVMLRSYVNSGCTIPFVLNYFQFK